MLPQKRAQVQTLRPSDSGGGQWLSFLGDPAAGEKFGKQSKRLRSLGSRSGDVPPWECAEEPQVSLGPITQWVSQSILYLSPYAPPMLVIFHIL